MKRAEYGGRIARDGPKIGTGGPIWLLRALFPIPQRAKRDLEPRREFFLRQA